MTMALNLKPWPYLCLVVEMHSSLIVYSGKLLIANSIWQACISIHALRESFFLIFSLSFFFLHFSLSLSLPSFFYLLCSFFKFFFSFPFTFSFFFCISFFSFHYSALPHRASFKSYIFKIGSINSSISTITSMNENILNASIIF